MGFCLPSMARAQQAEISGPTCPAEPESPEPGAPARDRCLLDVLAKQRVVFQAFGDRRGEAAALALLGLFESRAGSSEAALEHLQGSLSLLAGVPDAFGGATVDLAIGLVSLNRGSFEDAEIHLRKAADGFQALRGSAGPLDFGPLQAFRSILEAAFAAGFIPWSPPERPQSVPGTAEALARGLLGGALWNPDLLTYPC